MYYGRFLSTEIFAVTVSTAGQQILAPNDDANVVRLATLYTPNAPTIYATTRKELVETPHLYALPPFPPSTWVKIPLGPGQGLYMVAEEATLSLAMIVETYDATGGFGK